MKFINFTLLFLFVAFCNLNAQTVEISPEHGSGTCSDYVVTFDGITSSVATSFNFDGGTLPAGWSTSPFTISATTCAGQNSPDNSPYFWATTLQSSGVYSGTRFVQTNAVDVSSGGTISFYIRYGNNEGPGCEQPDAANEEVYLDYSTNGGSTWTNIYDGWNTTSAGNYSWYNWDWYEFSIPAGAYTSNTIFRWYQPGNSGADYDNWGLENVSIGTNITPTGYKWFVGGNQVATTEDLTYTFPSAGTYIVQLDVTFSNGSTKSKSIQYEVLENQSPTLNALANVTVQMNSGQQTVSLSGITDGDCVAQNLTLSTASGNSSIIPVPTFSYTSPNSTGSLYFTPAAGAYGIVQLTATITDDASNSYGTAKSLSRSFTVYVNDVPTNPGVFDSFTGSSLFIESTYDISWGASSDLTAGVTYYLEYSLNGGSWSTIAGGTSSTTYSNWAGHQSQVGKTIQFRVKSFDGVYYSDYTYSSTLNIISNRPPVANNDGPYNVYTGATVTGNLLTNDTDADGDDLDVTATPSLAHGSFDSFNLETGAFVYRAPMNWTGTFTFNYTISDGAATSSATATITVIDNIPPTALCQNVIVQLDANGNGSITATAVDNGSNDACGIQSLSLSQSSFDCSEVGTNTVTLTVTDNNSNTSSCSATVTVEDNVSPVALCQNVTVQLDANGNGSTTAAALNNGSTDACGIQSLSLSQSSFDCSEVGTNTVTLTVTDVNGNTSTCSATVTVEDNVAPLLSIQDITVYLDEEGSASITKSDLVTATSDNCAVLDTAISVSTFGCRNTGVNEVVVTLRDVNGNQTEETAIVTVLDDILPVAVCKDVTLFLDETGHATLSPEDVDGGSGDNCENTILAVNITGFDCNYLGYNTVILTVTDNSGNTANCIAGVTVVDILPPQIALIPDVEVVTEAGVCETAIDYPHPYVYDNCEITLELLSGLGEKGIFPLGTTTETWVATDDWGNSDTLSFNVTVKAGNAAPTVNAIHHLRLRKNSVPGAVLMTGISGGNDCEPQTVTVSAESSNTGLVSVAVHYTEGETGSLQLVITPEMTGESEITVTVTDSEGAATTTRFTVTVSTVLPGNHSPYVVTPIADQMVNASYVLKVPVPADMFADADGDELQVEVFMQETETLPEWAVFASDTIYFTPMIADKGCYHVVVKATDPEGAFATDTFQLCVDGYPVSAGEIAAGGFAVNLYPNPTRGEVTIGISSGFHNVQLTVSDIAGRAVLRKQYTMVERITFDMSDKVSGMYLVTLDIDGERTVKKLVVDRK